MSNSDTSTCIVCGKKYKTCLSCRHLDAIKPWRNIVDDVTCYKIFLIVSQYNKNHLSKEDARKQLTGLTFDSSSLREPIRKAVAEIMAVPESVKKTAPKSSPDKKCE